LSSGFYHAIAQIVIGKDKASRAGLFAEGLREALRLTSGSPLE
jgi:hypothetical protein